MEQSAKPTEAPKPKSRTMLLAIIIIVILVVVGVGVYILTRPPASPTGIPVSIFDGRNGGGCSTSANCGFEPTPLHVKIGTNNTVTWTNTGTIPHTVTSNQTANPGVTYDSGTMSHNAQFTYTYTQAGTYYYYCSIHALLMKGQVIVT